MRDLWSTWVVARQVDGAWRFLSDCSRWTGNWHEASLFPSLHGAEGAARDAGTARQAADVYQVAVGDAVAVEA